MEGSLREVSRFGYSRSVEVRAERSCGTPRLGQEPPPMPEEQEYDPRSLFEVRFFYPSD